MYGGMDAICKRRRRPDQGWSADWTPFGCWRGVQIAVVGRNGRQSVVGVASGFLVVADLDAYWVLAWRPDWGCMADWTPVGCWRGVQIVDLGRIGRHLRVVAASRLGLYGGLDASGWLARRPDLGSMADWTPLLSV